tara:strand:+ start:1111 stop:1470 length:360 start_codon:yes stop_codon:yes gene_type:complete
MTRLKKITDWIGERTNMILSVCLVSFIAVLTLLATNASLKNEELELEILRMQIEQIDLESQIEKKNFYLGQASDIISQHKQIIAEQQKVIQDLIKKLQSLQNDGRFNASKQALTTKNNG